MRCFAAVKQLLYLFLLWTVDTLPATQSPIVYTQGVNRNITSRLFAELEELARIVDISYCVGATGIHKPFICASRCQDFKGFELVTTWNTGPLLADSCGYIALSHPPSPRRIIIAFRGTYSISSAIVDLSTIPQEYVPYSTDGDDQKCKNCTVHAGFLTSWMYTRPHINPHLERLVAEYPDHQVTLVGHSLGGAVAALAGLEFEARGWDPQVTTFGEPRIGNHALMEYIDDRFELGTESTDNSTYRRVTHVDDPVPLLPLKEWGYRMHAGEVYISKVKLSPSVKDLHHCLGDEDPECIAGGELASMARDEDVKSEGPKREARWTDYEEMWAVPSRYRLWELFFAHRDYFWRLGLCIPGGDPSDWYREYPDLMFGDS